MCAGRPCCWGPRGDLIDRGIKAAGGLAGCTEHVSQAELQVNTQVEP